MPTQAFHLLDNDKKQALIEAAICEFESLPYEKVSIFKIAQNAGISRSGLYYYFKDKADIYRYIVSTLHKPFSDRVLQRGKGQDLFALAREFFIFLANYKHTKMERFVTQVLRDMKSVDVNTLVSAATLHKDDRHVKQLSEALDLSRLRTREPHEVSALAILIQTMSNYILLGYLEGDTSLDNALAQFDRGLDLLKYGFVSHSPEAADM